MEPSLSKQDKISTADGVTIAMPELPGRVFVIDLFRFIGLSSIILAHIEGVWDYPVFISMRTFDVPLMVFVTGMSYCISAGNNANVIQYFISRFKRLVLSTWSFITILYFAIYPLSGDFFRADNKFKIMISCYKLKGFGFFWVIRLFTVVSLFSPLYKSIAKLHPLVVFALYFVAMAALSNSHRFHITMHPHSNIFLWAIPYGLVFTLGYLYQLGRRDVFYYGAFSFVVMVVLEVWSVNQRAAFMWPGLQPLDCYDLFRVVWGVAICAVLCFIAEVVKLQHMPDGKLKSCINFVSSNTIWIFFWHIPMARYLSFADPALTQPILIKYIVIYSLSVAIVFVQRLLVQLVTRTRFKSFNKFVNTVFTG